MSGLLEQRDLQRNLQQKKQASRRILMNNWSENLDKLMEHKTLEHIKGAKTHGIKLVKVYKTGNGYSFKKPSEDAKPLYTLIVDNITRNDGTVDKTIPRGSLIIAINGTDLSRSHVVEGRKEFFKVYGGL